MRKLEDYQKEHKEIMESVTVLNSFLTKDQLDVDANARAVQDMLSGLSERINRHLSGEDQGLYPDLLTHEDPKIKAIAWGYLRGESPLRKTFEKYRQRWLKQRGIKLSEEFIADTRDLLAVLTERIEKEEKELFPVLGRAQANT
jgi:hemerythrin-like domain-containing protein